MKEVSCKLFTIYLKEFEDKNLPLEILCKDTAYTIDYIRNQKNFIDWDAFCQIHTNTREVYKNDEDYTLLGVKIVRSRMIPVLSAMLGFFVNPKELLRLLATGKKGLTGQTVTCITSTFTEIDENTIEITGELPDGYKYSKEFFLITKGVFATSPILVKHKPAHIIMTETGKGVHYKVTFSRRSTFVTTLKQFFSKPSSKKAALRELTETYELLHERYSQLEESREKIQKQAKQLETAYSISQLIRSDLDLNFTLNAVAESLINVAEFTGVEINIHSKLDHEQIDRAVRLGNVREEIKPLCRTLEAHGKTIGKINLWLDPKSSVEDAEHLLDYVIPTITMEILNALSFKLINDYRNKLEHKVEEIQLAIIDERRRISSEIHDDLGTNLSAIALMSGVMKEKVSGASMEKISVAAQQSLEKIGEIVWSLNPRNDKLENLLAYIRKYAVEYFEPTLISCKMNIPDNIPGIIIKGEQRRNIFLSVKEALHNILKHSDATCVELSFLTNENRGEIIIHDNGKGIAADQANSFGNGLQNMQQRMQSAGGYMNLKNNNGTSIHLGFGLT